MIDAALIENCSDPALKPAIVERFIAEAGSPDPLTVTVRSGDRVVLVPKPGTPDDAITLMRQYVGKAVVRVGITQYPAGLGIADPSELKPDLIDACENIRMARRCSARSIASSRNGMATPSMRHSTTRSTPGRPGISRAGRCSSSRIRAMCPSRPRKLRNRGAIGKGVRPRPLTRRRKCRSRPAIPTPPESASTFRGSAAWVSKG